MQTISILCVGGAYLVHFIKESSSHNHMGSIWVSSTFRKISRFLGHFREIPHFEVLLLHLKTTSLDLTQILSVQFSSIHLLSWVWLFATPWTVAHQASLSVTHSQSLLKLMFTESVMPSNHFILCRSLLLPHSIFPSIRLFSNESVLCIRWPKYWSFSLSISPSTEYSGLIS